MNNYIEKLKRSMDGAEPQEGNSLLELAQVLYENRSFRRDAEIERCYQEFEQLIDWMEFKRMDPICCAVNALCGQYEYTAFTEGFQKRGGLGHSAVKRNGELL